MVPHFEEMLVLALIRTQNLDNRFGIYFYFPFGDFILKMWILTCNVIFILVIITMLHTSPSILYHGNTLHILSPLILTIIPEGGHHIHLEMG